MTEKHGGTLSEDCTVGRPMLDTYVLFFAESDGNKSFTHSSLLRTVRGKSSIRTVIFGSFHCEDTQLASELTANTYSCWFDKYPDQKDLFDKPSEGCASINTPPPYDYDGV